MTSYNKKFVKEIVANQEVFALGLDGGYAKSLSNFYVDEEDFQIEIFCFWTSEKLAEKCVLGDWVEYSVVSLPLSTFMEDWCIGMSNENYAVGLDFDAKMDGKEVDPLELLLDICNEVIEKKLSLKFIKFKTVKEIRDHVIKALEYES